ncbi:MAG: ABC transporter substrate-binding protein [Dehalococcoidales bacterium]|nr:MAG: ABC transporter substrate-binding protein [Dehalococcoidales bacterium]
MKRIVWLVMSFVMVLSLVVMSCGETEDSSGTVKQEDTGQTVTIGEEEGKEDKPEKEVPEGLLPPDQPKYGGTIVNIGADPMGWDHYLAMFTGTSFCEDELMSGDWAKGPAGTGEMSWKYGNNGRTDVLAGNAAESWEFIGNDKIHFHIRPGVYFWDKPPANGRELTAEDVAWNIERQWTDGGMAFLPRTNAPPERLISAEAIDKYTVELTIPPHVQGLHLLLNGERVGLHAPEVVEQFGDYSDWKNIVSTGPFILTDYIPASSITYEKHPNYWQEDPLNPGNQLPYIDGVTSLIIADLSTRLAAFRTGKLDYMVAVTWEDQEQIVNDSPDIMWDTSFGHGAIIAMRCDKPELPFYDVKVRRAMNLAIDREALVRDYYNGNAELMGWPYYPIPDHSQLYEPLEDLSEGAQEVHTYNPQKARELLAEAGYPDGFKTQIDLSTASADFLSIIKEYFAAIGVDMALNLHEAGVFVGINRGRKHEEMLYKETKMWMFSWKMHEVRPESMDNLSFWGSPETREVYNNLNLHLGKDDAAWMAELKTVTSHMLEEAPYVYLPAPIFYDGWWPWMQNYFGAHNLGYFTPGIFLKFVWVDQDMKEKMGY